MLKINLKTIAGLFVAFVLAVTVTSVASAAWMSTTATKITKSSSSSDVMWLQSTLNAVQSADLAVDGKYGAHTTAAIVTFQKAHPSAGTADGIAGMKTIAALNAAGANLSPAQAGSYPAGCTSAVGFSSTTGASCSGTVTTGTLPAGCTSSAGYSPSTGMSCAGVNTPVVNSTGSGNISADSLLGGYNATIVGTGDTNHKVVGFQLTGAGGGSNVNLNSVTVQFSAAPFTGSCSSGTDCGSNRLSDYFSSVAIFQNGVQVGAVPASNFSQNTVSGLNNYVYSASIPLSNAVVMAGQNTKFEIAVSANASLDTGNFTAGNKWAVQLANIRYTDGTGVTLVYNPTNSFPTSWGSAHTPNDPSFSFGSAASANNIVLNIGRASSDMNAHTATVNATGGSIQKVPLLAMTLGVQGGLPIAVNKIPVTFTPSSGTTVYQLSGQVYLMSGSTVLDSETVNNSGAAGGCGVAATACTISFKIPSNPGLIVAPNVQSTLTVAADINSVSGGGYTGGASLTAATPAGTSGDTSYDLTYGTPTGTELVSSTNEQTLVPGSANGQAVAFYSTGASVAETSDVCTASNSGYTTGPSYLTCTIQYSVTANGAPVYIPQAAGTSATPNVIGFDSFVSSAPTTPIVSGASPAVGLSATVVQNGTNATSSQAGAEWTINAGVTANFTATVVISDPTSVHGGQYRSYLTRVVWGSASSNTTWANSYTFNLGSVNPVVPGYTQIN